MKRTGNLFLHFDRLHFSRRSQFDQSKSVQLLSMDIYNNYNLSFNYKRSGSDCFNSKTINGSSCVYKIFFFIVCDDVGCHDNSDNTQAAWLELSSHHSTMG